MNVFEIMGEELSVACGGGGWFGGGGAMSSCLSCRDKCSSDETSLAWILGRSMCVDTEMTKKLAGFPAFCWYMRSKRDIHKDLPVILLISDQILCSLSREEESDLPSKQ